MAIATYLPSSVYLGAASGNIFPAFAVPATNTNLAGQMEGIGVAGSLTSSTSPYSAVLQFNLGSTSVSALTARILTMSTSTSTAAVMKFTVNDGITAAGNSIGATSLTAESQSTVTSTGTDTFYETDVVLATAPTSAGILTIRLDFNSTGAWTNAAQSVWQVSVTQ